jgi:hypothetical protein
MVWVWMIVGEALGRGAPVCGCARGFALEASSRRAFRPASGVGPARRDDPGLPSCVAGRGASAHRPHRGAVLGSVSFPAMAPRRAASSVGFFSCLLRRFHGCRCQAGSQPFQGQGGNRRRAERAVLLGMGCPGSRRLRASAWADFAAAVQEPSAAWLVTRWCAIRCVCILWCLGSSSAGHGICFWYRCGTDPED